MSSLTATIIRRDEKTDHFRSGTSDPLGSFLDVLFPTLDSDLAQLGALLVRGRKFLEIDSNSQIFPQLVDSRSSFSNDVTNESSLNLEFNDLQYLTTYESASKKNRFELENEVLT